MRFHPDTWFLQLRDAVRHAVSSPRKIVSAGATTVVAYVLFMLSTFPEYSFQLLQSDVFYLYEAMTTLVWAFSQTEGLIGTALIVIYALLTGIAVVNMATLISTHGLSTIVTGTSSITPAFLIGGCAGCGAGLLGLFGFVGALSIFPFAGNGLRAAGILLLLMFLVRTGDPETCKV